MDEFLRPKRKEDILVDIDNLAQFHDEQQDNKIKYFNKILNECSHLIEFSHRVQNKTDCVFTIPAFSFDFPLYDAEDVRKYLIAQLQNKDYTVEFCKPNYLCISWFKKLHKLQKEREKKQLAPMSEMTKNEAPFVVVDSALGRMALKARLIQRQKEKAAHEHRDYRDHHRRR